MVTLRPGLHDHPRYISAAAQRASVKNNYYILCLSDSITSIYLFLLPRQCRDRLNLACSALKMSNNQHVRNAHRQLLTAHYQTILIVNFAYFYIFNLSTFRDLGQNYFITVIIYVYKYSKYVQNFWLTIQMQNPFPSLKVTISTDYIWQSKYKKNFEDVLLQLKIHVTNIIIKASIIKFSVILI